MAAICRVYYPKCVAKITTALYELVSSGASRAVAAAAPGIPIPMGSADIVSAFRLFLIVVRIK
jgi:hypothetical protein